MRTPAVCAVALACAALAAGWAVAQTAPPPPPKSGRSVAPPPPKAGSSSAPAAPAKAEPAAPAPQTAVVTASGPISDDNDPRVKAALARAAQWFRVRANRPPVPPVGELALMVHAMAKIRAKYPDLVPENDPSLQKLTDQLRAVCQDGFHPGRHGGPDNYEAGCTAMALTAAGGGEYLPEITNVAQYILQKQQPNGAWTYDGTKAGDSSMTQYGILGLWEASAGAGVKVPKEAWDRAAQWLVANQTATGGFAYHPEDRQDATDTMTVASLGSLYICRDHLPGGKPRNRLGVLLPVQEATEAFTPQTQPAQMTRAIERGTEWLLKNFTIDNPKEGNGRWKYYYMYAFERFGTLSGQTKFNSTDWYASGAQSLLAAQSKSGAWPGIQDGEEVQTSFAVLFLVRSTKVSFQIHERRLSRGTLVSNQGLPSDLSKLQQTGGQLKAQGLRGSSGQLLGLIETGKPEQLEAAAIGLVDTMYQEKKKWTAIGKEGDALRKMVAPEMPVEVKLAGLKLLAQTGDYRVVPLLIDAMYDDEASVQLAARDALCKISRKFKGFGYPAEPTLDEWKEEIEKWTAWYRSVRPEGQYEDDIDLK